MTGRIDKHGTLWIDRGAGEEPQYCPWTTGEFTNGGGTTSRPCGSWCPLFGTERVVRARLYEAELNGKHIFMLCHGTELIFDTLVKEPRDS